MFDRLTQAPFLLNSAGTQNERRRGLVALLDWLDEQPGAGWQDRWLASGADTADSDWRRFPAQWLRSAIGSVPMPISSLQTARVGVL